METLTCSLEELRLVTSKVCAAAVLELFPGTHLVSSHLTPYGFSCDFVMHVPLTEELLGLIEERMGQIVRQRHEIKTVQMVPVSAEAYFAYHGQPLLAEQVRDTSATLLTLVQMGEFTDRCSQQLSIGNSGELKVFRLFEVTKLQRYQDCEVTRVTGTAFFEKSALKSFIKTREEFPEKDHVRLGKELDLFTTCEEGALWHPRGVEIQELLLQFWKERLVEQNFSRISTRDLGPDLTNNHKKYFALTERDKRPHKIFEFAEGVARTQEKWERGLLSSRRTLVDRAHVFCTADDLLNECISSLQIICKILKILDFKFQFVFCSPLGKRECETRASGILEEAVQQCGVPYSIENCPRGCHNPAVEFRIKDGMGQEWVGPFVEIDCRGEVAEKIVTLSLFNSIERFCALLLENCEGDLPFWLIPQQVRIIGVKEPEYAEEIYELLKEAGLRAVLDTREEKLAKRLHEALCHRTPWLIVVGEREKRDQFVTVRSFSLPDVQEMSVEDFIHKVTKIENQ